MPKKGDIVVRTENNYLSADMRKKHFTGKLYKIDHDNSPRAYYTTSRCMKQKYYRMSTKEEREAFAQGIRDIKDIPNSTIHSYYRNLKIEDKIQCLEVATKNPENKEPHRYGGSGFKSNKTFTITDITNHKNYIIFWGNSDGGVYHTSIVNPETNTNNNPKLVRGEYYYALEGSKLEKGEIFQAGGEFWNTKHNLSNKYKVMTKQDPNGNGFNKKKHLKSFRKATKEEIANCNYLHSFAEYKKPKDLKMISIKDLTQNQVIHVKSEETYLKLKSLSNNTANLWANNVEQVYNPLHNSTYELNDPHIITNYNILEEEQIIELQEFKVITGNNMILERPLTPKECYLKDHDTIPVKKKKDKFEPLKLKLKKPKSVRIRIQSELNINIKKK